jgi:hypothetical protein
VNIAQLFVLFGVKVQKGQFKAATGALHELKAAAMAFAGVMTAVSIGRSLVHLGERAAETATHVVSMSKAMGMSIEMTQRWGYLAQQSGSNIKELSVGVNMFLRNLRLYAEGRGSKVLRDRFRELKISREEVQKALDAPDGANDMLMRASDGLHKMSDGMRKATETTLFGVKAGRAMLADLERGSPAIKELFDHFDKIGGVVGEKQVLDLRKMANAINDMKAAWDGVTGQIIGTAAPAITKLLEEFAMWFGQNKALIGEILITGVRLLMGAFRGLMAVVSAVGNVIHAAFAGDAGAQALIITVAELLLTLLLPAIITIGGAIWGALAPLLPLSAVIWALTVLVLLLAQNWDVVVATLKRVGMTILWILADGIEGLVKGVLVFISLVGMSLKEIGKGLLWVLGLPIRLFHGLIGLLAQLPGLIVRTFKNIGTKIIDTLGEAWDAVTTKVHNVWDRIYDVIKNAWARIRNLPGIHWLLDQAGVPDVHVRQSGSTNTSTVVIPTAPEPVTNAPFGSPAGIAQTEFTTALAQQSKPHGPTEVSVGPTTINLYGVKDATEAKDHIADSIDNMHRHANAALGGEIQ